MDPQSIDAFYSLVTAHWAEYGFGFWAVEAVETEFAGQLIGFAGLEFGLAACRSSEIGWRLSQRAWGFGFASEAERQSATMPRMSWRLPTLIAPSTRAMRAPNVLRRAGYVTFRARVYNPVLGREVEVWQTRAVSDERD